MEARNVVHYIIQFPMIISRSRSIYHEPGASPTWTYQCYLLDFQPYGRNWNLCHPFFDRLPFWLGWPFALHLGGWNRHAFAGAAVYLEFGTGLPRNGGEKNYLEYVSPDRSSWLRPCIPPGVMLLGWAGGNSVIFGEYILHAANVEVTRWNQRCIGLACITTTFLIHGLALKWRVRLQNTLGIIKLSIMLIIVVAGFVALGGHLKIDQKPKNFTNAFEGTTASA